MTAGRVDGAGELTKPSAFADPHERSLAARFGLQVFLASLVVLFGATLVGFIVIRYVVAGHRDIDADPWPTDLPPLPALLWVSTVVLVASSGTAQWAVRSIRRGLIGAATRGLAVTLGLGGAFLVLQALSWRIWHERATGAFADTPIHHFALTSFYILTALHAVHVIGGLIPMAVTTRRTSAGRYGDRDHGGIERCVTYWHFLDAVWLVLFAMLLIGM